VFSKKILGLILLVIGVGLYLFGNYVSNQVVEGKKKIEKTQRTVDNVRHYSKVDPYAEAVGKIATNPVQKKINEGREEVSNYRKLAKALHTSGLVLLGLGVLFLLLGFTSKKKH